MSRGYLLVDLPTGYDGRVFDLLTLGDSVNGAADAWPHHYRGSVLNLAVVGARIADLPEQVAQARPAARTVVSVGINDVIGPHDLDFTPLAALNELQDPVLLVPHRPPTVTHGEWLIPRFVAVRAALETTGHRLWDPHLHWFEWRRDGLHPNRLGHWRLGRLAVRGL